MSNPSRHGKSYWFDLPVTDPVNARSFYEGLFGWKFLLMNDAPVADYWVIQAGEEIIGGLRLVASAERGLNGAVLYFTVDDLDVSCARLKELGGTIVGKKVDLGHNRGAYQWFRDREGNLAALWAAAKESL